MRWREIIDWIVIGALGAITIAMGIVMIAVWADVFREIC